MPVGDWNGDAAFKLGRLFALYELIQIAARGVGFHIDRQGAGLFKEQRLGRRSCHQIGLCDNPAGFPGAFDCLARIKPVQNDIAHGQGRVQTTAETRQNDEPCPPGHRRIRNMNAFWSDDGDANGPAGWRVRWGFVGGVSHDSQCVADRPGFKPQRRPEVNLARRLRIGGTRRGVGITCHWQHLGPAAVE